MSLLEKVCIGFLISFFCAMIIAPLVIRWLRGMKAKQTILTYVAQHEGKKGTPTMGGIIFLVPFLCVSMGMDGYDGSLSLVFTVMVFAFGVVGFLDDFLKVKRTENLGLKPYQKLLGQLSVAVIAAVYCYKSPYIGSAIALPFTDRVFDMGYFYIPFAVVTFLAMSNAVNLTDGLDGLAGCTTSIYFLGFAALIGMEISGATYLGSTYYSGELEKLLVSVIALVGGVMGFLWFNSSKASVFMGDTGSLALGGGAGAIALMSKNPLASLLIGIVFVWSVLSVIIQVASFKLKKKRVFLMSPYHHHLELKGYNESKIVGFYGIVTAVATVLTVIIQ